MIPTKIVNEQGEPKVEKDINALIVKSEVEPGTAIMLKESFLKFFDQAEEWEKKAAVINVTSIDQVREMKMAKDIRLAVRDIRLDADQVRVNLKEESNRYNKAVQGIFHTIEFLTKGIEDKMKKHEKFKEDYEARARAELMHKREQLLAPYEKFIPSSAYQSLGSMKEEDFLQYLELGKGAMETARLQADKDRKEADKAAKAAEAKAKKDEEEKEKFRIENEKLIKKSKEQKALRDKEREASEKKRLNIVKQRDAEKAKAKKLKDELEARKKAEAKKVREAEETLRVEKAIKAKEEKERQAAKRKIERAPDKEKLLKFSKLLASALVIPNVKSQEAIDIIAIAEHRLKDVAGYILFEANKL